MSIKERDALTARLTLALVSETVLAAAHAANVVVITGALAAAHGIRVPAVEELE